MRFKKSKEDVLYDIKSNAKSRVYSVLYNRINSYGGIKLDQNSIIQVLQDAISDAMESSFRTMLELEYTDDDFERDLTLKP